MVFVRESENETNKREKHMQTIILQNWINSKSSNNNDKNNIYRGNHQ